MDTHIMIQKGEYHLKVPNSIKETDIAKIYPGYTRESAEYVMSQDGMCLKYTTIDKKVVN